MDIEHLREFSYLAETLNYGITAKHFFISTSVLSKHIASMEVNLAVKLFERDRKGVELTDAGRVFYAGVMTVLTDYDNALESISPVHASRKTLRVGYLRGAAKPFLDTFVTFFEKNYPNINLEITCKEYDELLLAHRSHVVDVLLNMELDPEAELACDNVPIYTDRLYAVMDAAYPLASRDFINADDLAGHPIILPDIVAYPGFVQHCEKIVKGVDSVNVRYRYKDVETLVFRISAGDCVGFSSGHNAAFYGSNVRFVPIKDIDTSYQVTARWLRVIDKELIEATKAAAMACAKRMSYWSDGVAAI